MRVGVRELRQNASLVLAAVERGEHVTVTVQGREVALMIPAPPTTWIDSERVHAIFDATVDSTWSSEVVEARRSEHRPDDPWSHQ